MTEGEMVSCFRRESGVFAKPSPSTVFEDGLDEIVRLDLTSIINLGIHWPSHVGDDNDVFRMAL